MVSTVREAWIETPFIAPGQRGGQNNSVMRFGVLGKE
jgi:hypothetical protein